MQDGGSGATNGPVALAVTLTVVPVPTPEIGLSSLSLAASTVAGMDALDLGFNVWNNGIGTLDYAVTPDADWLTATPSAGLRRNIEPPQWHTVSFHTASLPVGRHTTTITVTAPGANPSQRSLPVLVEFVPPACSPLTMTSRGASANSTPPSPLTPPLTAASGGNGGGRLVDIATGQPTGVQLSITGGAYYGDWQADLGNLSAPGHRRLRRVQRARGLPGPSATPRPNWCWLSGLDPAARYEEVVRHRDSVLLKPPDHRDDRRRGCTRQRQHTGRARHRPGGAKTTTTNGQLNTSRARPARYTDGVWWRWHPPPAAHPFTPPGPRNKASIISTRAHAPCPVR